MGEMPYTGFDYFILAVVAGIILLSASLSFGYGVVALEQRLRRWRMNGRVRRMGWYLRLIGRNRNVGPRS